MIALYTLWNKGDKGNTGGFPTTADMLHCMKLSMIQSAKWFERVVLITDTIGANWASAYDLPCIVVTSFDRINVKPTYWAMPKLIAMGMMNKPFAHIDNDFIFWQDPTPLIADADLCFQNKEKFSVYSYYTETLDEIKQKSPALYDRINDPKIQYAYNCGLVACNKIEVISEWIQRATSFVEEADALRDFSDKKGCFNHLLEQYIIALIASERSLKINVLFSELDMNTKLFTHIWGATKKNGLYKDAIKSRLKSAQISNKV